MTDKKDESSGGYNERLYKVCKYMLEHIEEYKGEPIYDIISLSSTMGGKRNKIGEKDCFTDPERISHLHNRLLVTYKFFSGKGIIPKKIICPKGYEIMAGINLERLSDEDLVVLFNYYYKFCVQDSNDLIDEDCLNLDGKRNLKHFLLNIDISKSTELLDCLIENLYEGEMQKLSDSISDGIKNFGYTWLIEQIFEMKENNRENDSISMVETPSAILIKCYNLYRNKLVYMAPRSVCPVDEYYKTRRYYYDKLVGVNKIIFFEKHEKIHNQFVVLEDYYYAWLYIELCCSSIIQYVISRIMLQWSYDIKDMDWLEKLNKPELFTA